MAGVGEAASIAGLIGLVGQTVQAASTLYTFFKAYKDVHPKAYETVSTLERLLNCLKIVQRALSNAKAIHGQTGHRSIEISAAVEDCHQLLQDVESTMHPIMADGKGIKRAKAKIAAQREFFTDINQQLMIRWQNLSTLISSAEWLTGVETLREVRNINTSVAELHCQQDQATQHISDQMSTLHNSFRSQEAQTTCTNEALTHKVDLILQGSKYAATHAHLSAIEARLAAYQLQLQQSIVAVRPEGKKSKSNAATRSRFKVRSSSRFPKLESVGVGPTKEDAVSCPSVKSEQLMRLVDTSILVHQRRGRVSYQVVATEDTQFMLGNLQQRIAMIQHLQGMRLLLWLFKEENYLSSIPRQYSRPGYASPSLMLDARTALDVESLYVNYLKLEDTRASFFAGLMFPNRKLALSKRLYFLNYSDGMYLLYIYFTKLEFGGRLGSVLHILWIINNLLLRLDEDERMDAISQILEATFEGVERIFAVLDESNDEIV